jgi:peptidyl-tRNA hydrolase
MIPKPNNMRERLRQCLRCGGWFPCPVEYHHTEEECRKSTSGERLVQVAHLIHSYVNKGQLDKAIDVLQTEGRKTFVAGYEEGRRPRERRELKQEGAGMNTMAMYIFLNKGLGMSTGKAAAQAAHAAILAHEISSDEAVADWNRGGHYKKLVMQARDAEHLAHIQKYLTDRGIKSAMVIDEGLTEIPSHTPTALGVEIVDKADEHVEATFSTFELYRETVKVSLEIQR